MRKKVDPGAEEHSITAPSINGPRQAYDSRAVVVVDVCQRVEWGFKLHHESRRAIRRASRGP